jgi:hypothetical protein
MAQADRHETICQCVLNAIDGSLDADDPMSGNTRIEDFNMTAEPTYGIIVSPEDVKEDLLGTNERDDLTYSCLVTRCIHAMHNEDRSNRLGFQTKLRLLFNRKRLSCDDGCHLYMYVQQGAVKVPQAWQRDNNSISITRVNAIVRESRIEEADTTGIGEMIIGTDFEVR